MSGDMVHWEFDELLRVLLSGTIDHEQKQRLNAMLADDPAAQQAYWQMMQLDALLRWLHASPALLGHAASSTALPAAQAVGTMPAWRTVALRVRQVLQTPVGFGIFLATVACLSLLLTAAQVSWQPLLLGNRDPAVEGEPRGAASAGGTAEAPTARVTRATGCVWSDGLRGPRRIPVATPLELVEGNVELTFQDGAVMRFHGPATFQIGPGRVQLASGSVAGLVPRKAQGFTVEAPGVRVVDLGTEFGLRASAPDAIDLQVFSGQVAVYPLPNPAQVEPLVLGARQATRVEAKRPRWPPDATGVPPATPPQRRAHYPLDEQSTGEATRVHDAAGDQHGTLVGETELGISGVHNRSLFIRQGGVRLPPAALHAEDDFTLTLWVNLAERLPFCRIVDCTEVSHIFEHGYRILGTQDKISFRIHQAGRPYQILDNGPIRPGQWYFVAVRYDKDAAASLTVVPRQAAPLSAAEVFTHTTEQPARHGAIDYEQCVSHLGHSHDQPASMHQMHGWLDDVAMFTSLLTDSQLAEVYNRGAAAVAVPVVPHRPLPTKDHQLSP